MRQFLVGKYAYLQHFKLMDRTCIQEHIKCGLVEPLLKKVKREIVHRAAHLTDDKDELEQLISTIFDVHAEIESDCKEESSLKSIINPVTPVKRMLVDSKGGSRHGDYVYDVPMEQQLQMLLENDRDKIKVSITSCVTGYLRQADAHRHAITRTQTHRSQLSSHVPHVSVVCTGVQIRSAVLGSPQTQPR